MIAGVVVFLAVSFLLGLVGLPMDYCIVIGLLIGASVGYVLVTSKNSD
jgi:hypothetical protein